MGATMKALHVRLEALTATYPYPFLRSGTQITLPAPPFSSMLGNISACAGRPVLPPLRIGFEFRSVSWENLDLERTHRLGMSTQTGRLSANPERGIVTRQFHSRPQLDLYLTDLSLRHAFDFPVAAPCLGRSQDLAWVALVREIELEACPGGELGPTSVPFPNFQVGGRILPPLADYYRNDELGHTRQIGRLSRYQFIQEGAPVISGPEFQLWRACDRESDAAVVFLHQLSL